MFFSRRILACHREWEALCLPVMKGLAYSQSVLRSEHFKEYLLQLLTKGKNPFWNIWPLMLQQLTISLVNVFCSEICLPLIDILSPVTFTRWGIHTVRNKLLFYMTILCYLVHLKTGACPLNLLQSTFTKFLYLLLMGHCFQAPYTLLGFLWTCYRWWRPSTVSCQGLKTVHQALSDQCTDSVKLNTLTAKGHTPRWDLTLHTAVLQVFICLRSTLEYSRFLFKTYRSFLESTLWWRVSYHIWVYFI